VAKPEAQDGKETRDAPIPETAGRTYAIPFIAVWDAALKLAHGRLAGWTVVHSDDLAGTIEADVKSMIFPRPARAIVSVTLDADAQTRFDLSLVPQHRGTDLGVHRRRIKRFLHALDGALAVQNSRS